MKTETVQKLVWPLIFGGMGLAMLGLWSGAGEGELALGVALLGGAMVLTGAVLVWVRSRMSPRADGSVKRDL